MQNDIGMTSEGHPNDEIGSKRNDESGLRRNDSATTPAPIPLGPETEVSPPDHIPIHSGSFSLSPPPMESHRFGPQQIHPNSPLLRRNTPLRETTFTAERSQHRHQHQHRHKPATISSNPHSVLKINHAGRHRRSKPQPATRKLKKLLYI